MIMKQIVAAAAGASADGITWVRHENSRALSNHSEAESVCIY